MSYLMPYTGSTPIGELYISPAKDNTYYLRVHYYSGGDVTLLKIKKKKDSPDEDSVEAILQKLEAHMDEYYEKLFNQYVKKLESHIDKYFEKIPVPGYKKFRVEHPEIEESYTYKKFKDKKDSYPVKPGPQGIDMDYMVENIDTYHDRL